MSKSMQLLDHRGVPFQREDENYRTGYTLKELEVIIAREQGYHKGSVSHPMAQVTDVWSCIVQSASAFAQVEWGLWRRVSGGGGRRRGYVEVDKHPLADLMYQPNPLSSHFRFKEDRRAKRKEFACPGVQHQTVNRFA